jgi:hypothetical protein
VPEGGDVQEGLTTGGGHVADGVFSVRHDRQKVTDWVYEEVRAAIIDLRLQPGEALREAAIAAQLGVSKTPVRKPSRGCRKGSWTRRRSRARS